MFPKYLKDRVTFGTLLLVILAVLRFLFELFGVDAFFGPHQGIRRDFEERRLL